MTQVSKSFTNIHNVVTWLRDRDIRLNTPALMAQVKVVLKQACSSANDDSIDRFARVLRNLLSVEKLPAHFTVTNGVSVPFHNIGDVVDGQFVIQKQRLWYAGVVVGKRPSSCELSYLVFWLGQPHKKNQPSKNPQWTSVHSLRSHLVECSNTGSDSGWTNIDKIRSMCQEGAFEVVPPVQPIETAETSADKPAEPSSVSTRPAADRVETLSPSGDQGEGRPKRVITIRDPHSPEANGGGGQVRTPRSRSKGKPPGIVHPPANQQSTLGGQNSSPQAKQQSTLGSQNSFEIADSVKFAIDCLESLDRGECEHPETWNGLVKRIKSIAASLASIYNNKSYNTMVSETLAELHHYAGPEAPRLPHSKSFLDLLAKYGFCITPRMFSKCEILCIGIAMLDTKHHYVRIQ